MKVNIKAITRGLQHNSVSLLTINDVIPLGQYRGTTINSLIKTSAKYLKWLISEDIIKLDKQAMKKLNEQVCDASYKAYNNHKNKSRDYNNSDCDHDFNGLTAFDIGADF